MALNESLSSPITLHAEPSHDSTWLDNEASEASSVGQSMRGHRRDYRWTALKGPCMFAHAQYVMLVTLACNAIVAVKAKLAWHSQLTQQPWIPRASLYSNTTAGSFNTSSNV